VYILVLNTFPVLCLVIFNRDFTTPPSSPKQPLKVTRLSTNLSKLVFFYYLLLKKKKTFIQSMWSSVSLIFKFVILASQFNNPLVGFNITLSFNITLFI
jgi:hypothetical protein